MIDRTLQPAPPLRKALDYILAAVEILDSESAPAHIAAHLDYIGHLLSQEIAAESNNEDGGAAAASSPR